MKCICVTGASQIDLENVATILYQSGMSIEQSPDDKPNAMSMASWHQHVVEMLDEEIESPIIENPGRFLEQIASDIFLANINKTLWGWADTQSTFLLDFWQNYDPRIYFVLVCISPEQMLANAMRSQDSSVNMDMLMMQWQKYHLQLLRFHLRNAKRSVLVDASDCVNNPSLFVANVSKQWNIKAAIPRLFTQPPQAKNSYLLFLAHRLCEGEVQIHSLQNELSAVRLYLNESTPSQQDCSVYAVEDVLASYYLEQQTIATAEIIAKNKIDDLERKGEHYFEQLSNIQAELTGLCQSRDALNEQLAQQQAHTTHLHQQLEAISAQSAQQQHNSDEQIRQLQQANETKESVIAEQQGRINHLTETNTQNSELLLLELHQAHQESEHYFEQYQEKDSILKQAETRWQRMLDRCPEYFDYDSLKVDITVKEKNKQASYWQLKNVNAAGRTVDVFNFSFEVLDNQTAIIFYKEVEGAACFMRWPQRLANQDFFKIIFGHNGAESQHNIDAIDALTASDWAFLRLLSRWLHRTLENPVLIDLPRDLPFEALHTVVERFILFSSELLEVLRYDDITLRREQINPDYEHLWLKLTRLSFTDQCNLDFEFRLSCANVRPNAFGVHPKLEFPQEMGEQCFDSWFEESYDDFGAKLELRFALPDAMDMTVWGKLSAHDQKLVYQLIAQLPNLLANLVQKGVKLKRPLSDWLELVGSIQQIYAMRVLPIESQAALQASEGKKISVAAEKSEIK